MRLDLFLRTTANFLLAYAAFNPVCRPFLVKYYNIAVKIPADWIDVAEQYQVGIYRVGYTGGDWLEVLQRDENNFYG